MKKRQCNFALTLARLALIALAILTAIVGLGHNARIPAISETQFPHGEWEGIIAFERVPWVIAVNFDTRRARIDQAGSTSIPLHSIHYQNPRISFTIFSDSKRITFDGTFEGSILTGQVRRKGTTASAALRLLPELPKPLSREQAWQQDLDAAIDRFLAYDRSFSPTAHSEFKLAVSELRSSLTKIKDQQVIVALSQAVALRHNAHTRLYLLRMQTVVRRYPIRLWWFKDGLYVVKATAKYQETLGCRVIEIGNYDPESVRASVRTLFAGNDSWTDYMGVYYMTSPEVLYGLGLIPDMERTAFTFDDCKAGRFTSTVEPLPLHKTTKPIEAWWDLSPLHHDDPEPLLQSLADRSDDLPLYLRHPDNYYWFEYLPTRHAIYFQYNKSLNALGGENFQQFAARLVKFIHQHPIAVFILDLRFNTGGDLTIASPLMQELHDRLRGKHLFVITGRATFSAGLYHAARWKQWGDATFVGEPVGDKLDFWAEGGELVLPNSHLTLRYSNGFHKYSRAEYPQFKPYFMQLHVSDLTPDVLIQLSAKDYFAGRDPALECILSGSTRHAASSGLTPR